MPRVICEYRVKEKRQNYIQEENRDWNLKNTEWGIWVTGQNKTKGSGNGGLKHQGNRAQSGAGKPWVCGKWILHIPVLAWVHSLKAAHQNCHHLCTQAIMLVRGRPRFVWVSLGEFCGNSVCWRRARAFQHGPPGHHPGRGRPLQSWPSRPQQGLYSFISLGTKGTNGPGRVPAVLGQPNKEEQNARWTDFHRGGKQEMVDLGWARSPSSGFQQGPMA